MVIDKVLFKDGSASKNFSNSHILLNPDLNVIIRGKSSGKSLLLYHIARAVDPTQVRERIEQVGFDGYEFEHADDFDFEVRWSDSGRCQLRGEHDQDQRRITYIPQLYINHLAEERGEEHLKDLIETILRQNDEFREFLAQVTSDIALRNSEISNSINDLFLLRDNHSRLRDELKDIGQEDAIKKQVSAYQRQVETLRKSSGFSTEESEAYESLVEIQAYHQAKVARYKHVLEAVAQFVEVASAEALETAESNLTRASQQTGILGDGTDLAYRLINSLASTKSTLLGEFRKKYSEPDEALQASLEAKISKHEKEAERVAKDLAPYLSKIKNQRLLGELQGKLKSEESKLLLIAQKKKQLSETTEAGSRERKVLVATYEALQSSYRSIVDKLEQAQYKSIGRGLVLTPRLEFDSPQFDESFLSLFDRRSGFASIFGSFYENNQYSYHSESHSDNVFSVFDTVSKPDASGLRYRGENTPRHAAFKLFADYFSIRYTLAKDGDDILRMSPGKKGLVLLELILHLSNAEHPILIDQPEDNLDNRTIFRELSQFVREKKKQRQIIFVTHNANLVVATDADNVITANQSGEDAGKDNHEFRFEYVSGALEHTFVDYSASGILYQMGTREHICEILEGGRDAFEIREQKYGFNR